MSKWNTGGTYKWYFFTISALTDARSRAIEDIKKKASKLGANAVLSFDIDISDLDGRGILVSANGTAAYIVPCDMETREETIKREQAEREAINAANRIQKAQEEVQRRIQLRERIDSNNGKLVIDAFFTDMHKCSKYREIYQLWKDMKLDTFAEFGEIDKKIQDAVQMERFYGSRASEIEERMASLKKEFYATISEN